MEVEVKLFASFRNNRWKGKRLLIDCETSIKDILNILNIKEEELGIILVNGSYSKIDTILKNNDVLAIFPPVAGG